MLDFRILGPFEVHRGGEPLPLGGRQQRALLAALTLRANELVSAERLIDELWPEDPPDTADHLVHVYISRLRKALGDDGRDVLVTRQPGYELLVTRGHRDLDRFEDDLAGARAARDEGRLDAAAAGLREAIALWRGPALADLVSESFARADTARLNELRIAAIEDLVEVELARGDPDMVPQLRSLVEEHPLRERLRGFLMVALYREGRQAEALQAYEEARSTLSEELGIDPSQDLQDLYRRVLNQDPELRIERPVLRAATVAEAGAPADGTRIQGEAEASVPAPPRRPTVLAGGIAVLALLVVAGTVAVLRDGDTGGDGPTAEVVRISPDGMHMLERFPFDGSPSTMATDGSILWIADRDAKTITRLDTGTGERRPPFSAGGVPYAIEAAGDRAWVMDPFGGTVTLIDGDTPPKIIRQSRAPVDAVFAFDALWVLDAIDGSVSPIDPDDGHPLGPRIQLPEGSGPIEIDAGPGAIWVLNALDRSLSRIDPDTGLDPNDVALYCPSFGQACRPTHLAVSGELEWVTIEHAGTIELFDEDGQQVSSVEGWASPSDLVASADGSWIVMDGGSSLMHLDVHARPTGEWHTSRLILGIAGDGREPWTSLGAP
jgi:DNA-binding SARP family transcriptional activator